MSELKSEVLRLLDNMREDKWLDSIEMIGIFQTYKPELLRSLGLHQEGLTRALSKLYSEGKVERRGSGKPNYPYEYRGKHKKSF